MVLHTASEQLLGQVLGKLLEAPITNLWKPKPGQFLAVTALPYLGSGKLVLKELQRMADSVHRRQTTLAAQLAEITNELGPSVSTEGAVKAR